jgi:hypothetical protein
MLAVYALQVGLCSSNSAVVCATIRVAGALLQALLLHTHLTADTSAAQSTSSHHKGTATIQQHVEQLQSLNEQTHGHLNCAAAAEGKPVNQQQAQQQHQQHVQQGCSESADWLDDTQSSGSLLSDFLRGTLSAGGLDAHLPAAAAHLASANPTADSSSAAENGNTSAMDAAMLANSMLSALLVCASSSSSSVSSSSICVDVPVGALLELQQFMLLLADTQTGALDAHTATACDADVAGAPQGVSHGIGAGCVQHQGSNSTSRRIQHPALLGMGWLQEAVAACMQALTHEDATMRR